MALSRHCLILQQHVAARTTRTSQMTVIKRLLASTESKERPVVSANNKREERASQDRDRLETRGEKSDARQPTRIRRIHSASMSATNQQYMTTRFVRASTVSDASFDCVVVIAHSVDELAATPATQSVAAPVKELASLHKGALARASILPVDKSLVPSGRLIFSGTGPVNRDYDDVRRFQQAGKRAFELAIAAGVSRPLLVTVPHKSYPTAELLSILGALEPSYIPLNVREEDKSAKFECLGLLPVANAHLVELAEIFDASFTISRDIGEQGPERMAPPRTAQYVKQAFANSSSIALSVISDMAELEREYPLIGAVNRCANHLERHRAHLIRLEYTGEGEIKDTLYLVGKGVTLDTGGVDLKIMGSMHGMCRDKYGAAVVAGFFKVLEHLKPKGIKVVGWMSMVRNSIGANAYTTDEVLLSRNRKRIHIYNTDAEGRLIMLDPLIKAKEEALTAVNPHLMTLATLTGHEVLSYGHYASMMNNGPAKKTGLTEAIQKGGDEYGQPVEITRLHQEDFLFHLSESPQADLRQCNTKPSSQTMRGHMTPAAFLIQASGLDEHGSDSDRPIAFTHVDMGSAPGDHPTTSYPNPLVALVAGIILPRI